MSLNTLAQAQFREHFHACAFVTGSTEERAVIHPFLIEGMRRNEKAFYSVDPAQRDEHHACLEPSAPSPDLLEVTPWTNTHLKGGVFEQDRMIADLEQLLREHAATGRPPMRIVGQMSWMFSTPPDIETLVAYEAT